MANYYIHANEKKSKISKHIYGHFSEHLGRCIYEGIYVGKDSDIPNTNGMRQDVVEALRNIKVPVLRWPGGCFADEYHWKDGIGETSERKRMVNTNWGGVVEDNSFGTHEFMELCSQVGCEPYINGNLGSGTVQEMSEWVEYMTFDGISPMAELRKKHGHEKPWSVTYFGVGNENWGCGGNMTPEYYSNEYRRYQSFLKNYGENHLYKIACGPNGDDYAWTDTVMKMAGKFMDGLSLHNYTFEQDWDHKGKATSFDTKGWYSTLKNAINMETLIKGHEAIMDQYDPEKRVGLIVDEWGTWHQVEEGTHPGFLFQQNTMRDAMVAAVTLNIFNKHSDRVRMANIAQIVNVLQAVILTEGDQMVLTPTYHVFDLYQSHQEAELLYSNIETNQVGEDDIQVNQLSESASIDEEGNIHITLANLSLEEESNLHTVITGAFGRNVKASILTGEMDAYNDFAGKDKVTIQEFDKVSLTPDGFDCTIPPRSIVLIELRVN